jgi:hypothetical protein
LNIDFLEFLQVQTAAIEPKAYLEYAPQDAILPYVVYTLRRMEAAEGNRNDITIEFNVFDKGNDTTAIENMSDRIKRGLDRLKFVDPEDKFHTVIYFVNGLMIPDSDPNIRRRALTFKAKTYFN